MNVRNVSIITGYYPDPEKMGKTFYYKESDGDKKSILRTKLNVKRAFKDKDGNNIYDWIPFTAFGHNADYIHSYANPGDIIQIQGEIQISENYEKDGKTVYGQPFVLVDAVSITSSGNVTKDSESSNKTSSPVSAAKKKTNPLARLRAK